MRLNKGKGYTKHEKVTKWQGGFISKQIKSLYLRPKFKTVKKIFIIVILNLSIFAVAQKTLPRKNVVFFYNTQSFGQQPKDTDIEDSIPYDAFVTQRISLTLQQADSNYTWMWDNGTNIWDNHAQRKVVDYIIDGNDNVIGFTGKTWANSQWNNSAKCTQAFNPDKYMTSSTMEYWYNNGWVIGSKNTYTYDSNNNCTHSLEQNSNSGALINSSQTISTYSLNNLLSYLTQTWTAGSWVNVDKQTYSYNTNNLCISTLNEYWNGSSWGNSYYSINTFDVNNDMVSSMFQSWNGSSWQNSGLSNGVFDNQHRLITHVYKTWDGTTWENYFKDDFTYNAAGSTLSTIRQLWDGTNWVNDNRRLSSYNASDKEVKNVNEKWENMAWIKTNTGSLTYDSNNFCTSASFRTWDNSGVNVVSGDSTFYFGGGPTISAITDINMSLNTTHVFPNPTQASISVMTSLKYESIRILNASGQVVLVAKWKEQPFYVGLLTNGIYFAEILNEQGKSIKTEKFIKN